MPYKLSQSIEDRVHTSIKSSLNNLTFPGSEPYIDCLVLHSPLPTITETLQAWKAFSFWVPSRIHSLGISNTTLQMLQELHAEATIKPSVVQNRFYPDTQWEVPLREWCREKGIVFQSFWTLTGNPGLMESNVVSEMSQELESKGMEDGSALALYALVLGLDGTSVLNGTTNEGRMKNDLERLEVVGKLIEGEWKEKWATWLTAFKRLIDEPERSENS
jgi:diketogulonate reductase-like aldo/keto reductase